MMADANSLESKLAQIHNVTSRRIVKGKKQKTSLNAKSNKSKSTTTTSRPNTVTPSPKYTGKIQWKERKDSGKVIMEIGDDQEMGKSHYNLTNIEQITKVPTPFRYMYDKLRQKSDALSNHLNDIGELLLEQNDLGYATPTVTSSGV